MMTNSAVYTTAFIAHCRADLAHTGMRTTELTNYLRAPPIQFNAIGRKMQKPAMRLEKETLERAQERLSLHELIRVGVARQEDLRLLQQESHFRHGEPQTGGSMRSRFELPDQFYP